MTNSMPDLLTVEPESVRYIKLGSGQSNETKKCLENDDAFVHFGTSESDAFQMARSRNWDGFKKWFLSREDERVNSGQIKAKGAKSNATSACNQVQAFVEAGSETLWFTFHDGQLYWAFLDSEAPSGPSARGYVRKVIGKWSNKDLEGKERLHFNDLSGRLTRTAAYRSTTCEVEKEAADYLVRRLRGLEPTQATDAKMARKKLACELVDVIQEFTFKDFELLSELVLTSVGWRRRSLTGSSMPFVDIVLEQPLDGRVIGAQVKSELKREDFEKYSAELKRHLNAAGGTTQYSAFYFIYHTDKNNLAASLKNSHMQLMGPSKVADLAIRAGLVDWVIDRIL